MTIPTTVVSPEALKTCAIACLRAPFDAEAAAQARAWLSAPDFPWSEFIQLLNRERISPLIHYQLAGWGLFPADAAASLHRSYLKNALVNSQRLEELEKVLDCFFAHEIQVTLLKGVALTHTIYAKSALRPMSDMDVLVRAEDVEKAQQLLLANGYTLSIPAMMPKEFDSEIGFQKPGVVPLLDLHYSLFTGANLLSPVQLEWFLNKRALQTKHGRAVWTFDPDAQLLHLSAHLWLHHGGGDLLGQNDVYQVICQNQEKINWQEVIVAAQNCELLLPLKKILVELATKWHAPVPGEVLDQLHDMQPTRREMLKIGKFWRSDQNYADNLFSSAMSYPDWPSRLRYLWMMVFPRSEFIRVRYQVRSPLLLPYFYIYRLASRSFQQLDQAFHGRTN